ncbi:MAG: peptidylprolyl isomerase, partial [Burkholderiaceae bacterium]
MSNPQVELHISHLGVVTIELDAENAPLSTANFLEYVASGHYDNTVFHR